MSPEPSVILVIPTRFGSSRFPGKPLASIAGKPLIQHVYERVSVSSVVDRVLIATDDTRIRDVVEGFGGTVVVTDSSLRTGTDRVAAVAQQVPGHVFVNMQGDEIPLNPALISDLVLAFGASGARMGTLKRKLQFDDDVNNPALVKVVTNHQDEALYFSRAPIPHYRDGRAGAVVVGLHYLHLGVYIYTRETLLQIAKLPTGRLEDVEKLEQLRALEHGIPIRVWETVHPSLRIDRPEDVSEAALALQSHMACEATATDADA